jgi:hypothetical protein
MMTAMAPQAAPDRPDRTGPPGQDGSPRHDDPGSEPAQPDQGPGGKPAVTVRSPADKPAVPVRSRDDSDVGWGERPASDDDDERLYRERPPHWDSA